MTQTQRPVFRGRHRAGSGSPTTHAGRRRARAFCRPLQAEPLVPPELRAEHELLTNILYKNKNQHRRAKYFKQLQGVGRELDTLARLQLDGTLCALGAALAAGLASSTLPVVSLHVTMG